MDNFSSSFRVSVIIPFYNARDYVTQAVESALSQPETGEVLVIEDGSPDRGLEVCQALEQNHQQVRLLRHEGGRNCGPSASRNLGIRNAKFTYIAFLDADDYFLPNRFQKTAEVFANHEHVDGVYEAIGAIYQKDEYREQFLSLNFKELTTVTKVIEPGDLFDELMSGKSGYFSFDGFTGRKQSIIEAGLFREDLRFLEDTDLMLKLSVKTQLMPGQITAPVAIRRVHDKNRVTQELKKEREIYQKYLSMWNGFHEWGKENLNSRRRTVVALRLLDRFRKSDYFRDFHWGDFLASRKKMLDLAITTPELIKMMIFWRMVLPSSKCFGHHDKGNSN